SIFSILGEERHRVFCDVLDVDTPHDKTTGLNPFPGMPQHREFNPFIAFGSPIMVIRWIDPADCKCVVGCSQTHGISTNRLLWTKAFHTFFCTGLIQFVRVGCEIPFSRSGFKKFTVTGKGVDDLVAWMSRLDKG